MAKAVFRPQRRLRWHYRSRHSGLIQFSNRHVYDNDLVIFPSPTESRPDMGVSLVEVNGCYRSGVNSAEASVIVDAALRFMRDNASRSLGIVTLNQKQRDLILEEMERAIDRDTLAAKYIEDWLERNDGLESFFVKNLENVQGDERDVIFIGTVYGPEKAGMPVMQRFGPVNGSAGKRRLNVLFSRAKEQIVTFSSMTAADIKADESNPGAYMLKCWLEYAKAGRLDPGEYTNREPDSDFEVFVINQLRAMGCETVPQVGVAGFRIDIGVKHSSWPYGYIMGVECDGATYHSSRSARDRDRLREEVLTNLGWKLHRIWSTSWFSDPSKERQRLQIAVEDRLQELQRSGLPSSALKPVEQKPSRVEEATTIREIKSQNKINEDEHHAIFSNDDIVEIGDTVRVRYLDGEQSVREVKLSDMHDAPEHGIININKPLGRALLDAELGEQIEILNGNFVRKAQVEHITKAIRENANKDTQQTKAMIAHDKSAYNLNFHGLNEVAPPKITTPMQVEKNNDPSQVTRAQHLHLLNGLIPTNTSPIKKYESRLSPERFYEPTYKQILLTFATDIIDSIGPITFKHLSEIIARAHKFQRTGSQIQNQIKAAISSARQQSKAPNGETIFWPKDTPTVENLTFRGMNVNGEERSWQNVPYPERLGLALDVLKSAKGGDQATAMAAKIGLGRLRQSTREEFEQLLMEAKKLREC
jgi:transcription elongation GreA/GreB family factor